MSVDLSEGRPHPEKGAGIISRITFWWVGPLIKAGYEAGKAHSQLVNDDLWEVAEMDSSKVLRTKVDEAYAKLYQKEGKSPTVLRVLWEAFGGYFIMSGFFKLINDIFVFSGPMLISALLGFVQDPEAQSLKHGLLIAVAFFFCSTIQSLAVNSYFYMSMRVGVWLRCSQILNLYRKSLSMSNDTRLKPEFHTGRLVTMMSNDCQRLQDVAFFLHLTWSAPLQFLTACVLLFLRLGWPALVGVSLMVILLPVNARIMKKMFKYAREKVGLTDSRIKHTNEMFAGIKIVKVMAWEQLFCQKLFEIRDGEIQCLKKSQNLRLFSFITMNITPILVAAITFTIYAILPNRTLDAQTIFPSLSLLSIIRFPLLMMPGVLAGLTDAHVSLKRLETYLESPSMQSYVEELTPKEQDQDAMVVIQNGAFHWYEGVTPEGETITEKGKPLKKYAKFMRKLRKLRRKQQIEGPTTAKPEFSIVQKPVLTDINLTIQKGSLTFIIGETGSGKSSLLGAIMGHIDRSNEEARVARTGTLAFVAQEAWIMNTTLRNNITFQLPFGETKYKGVLEACQLNADMKQLDAGDMTEIGEKGINLSGGQKQRVALARAVYADADVYLLDDPLSAVDAHVGKKLFFGCISDTLKGKTRILATHQLQFLPHADQIIMIADQKISFSGTYAEFVQQGLHLKSEMGASSASLDALDEAETPTRASPSIETQSFEADVPAATNGSSTKDVLPKVQKKAQKKKKSQNTRTNKGKDEDGEVLIIEEDDSEYSSEDEEADVMREEAQKQNPTEDHPNNEPHQPHGAARKRGKLMTTEESAQGSVAWSVYQAYIQAGGGYTNMAMVLGVGIAFEVCRVTGDTWLSIWSSRKFDIETGSYIGIYMTIVVACAVMNFTRGHAVNFFIRKASKHLHNSMLKHVMKAPMAFFDTTPLGRILNRFTKDIDCVDTTLPGSLNFGMNTVFSATSAIMVITIAQPPIIVMVIIMGFVYLQILRYFIPTFRDTKRLDSVNKSPVFAHFSETLSGTSTILAYGGALAFREENEHRLDDNIRSNTSFMSTTRWLGVRLEFLGNLLTTMLAIIAILIKLYFPQIHDVGMIGLSLVYSLQLTNTLTFLVRQVADIEAQMNGVERIQEYTTELPQEPDFEDYGVVHKCPPADWPAKGDIKFEDVTLRYREGLPLVLKGCSFHIQGPEKVGIVGRTGSGKSTTLLALFRLIELAGGRIVIDGFNISEVRLQDLRQKLTIIPQDPMLFHGTVRSNLDPFNQSSDQEIWDALEKTNMHTRIGSESLKLEAPISENGNNFSVGQRQLLCLTRAILKNATILLLDEATASVDHETDRLIQRTIRTAFGGCTVLTIAHRLHTIMDYDKVIVMDNGLVAEFDSPQSLLDSQGHLYDMAMALGQREFDALHGIACGKFSPTEIRTASPISPADIPVHPE